MKALKWLLIVIAALAAILAGVGWVLPDEAHIERAITVKAPPSTVYTVLNGFRRFNEWSPWAELDPNATYVAEGPPLGVGAKHSWRSEDPSVGAGSQEVVANERNREVQVRLQFEGFDSDNLATYRLSPAAEGTEVVWVYDTHAKGHLLNRYFSLLLDDMLGPDMDKGLAKLKAFVEALPDEDFSDLQIELVTAQATPIVYAAGEAPAEQAGEVLAQRYASIMAFLEAQGVPQAAAPIAITREFNEETHYWQFHAAIPVGQAMAPPQDSGLAAGQTYAGLALRAVHTGAYAAMEPTYGKLIAFKTVAGLEDNGDSWEQYVSDPASTAETELVTHIFWPVK